MLDQSRTGVWAAGDPPACSAETQLGFPGVWRQSQHAHPSSAARGSSTCPHLQPGKHIHSLPVSILANRKLDVNLDLQANSSPRQLNQEVNKSRSALLSDICQGAQLKKVAVVNDRSAPLLHSRSPAASSPSPVADHPYIRLYHYLHQSQPKQQGAPSPEQKAPLASEGKTAVAGGRAAQVLASHPSTRSSAAQRCCSSSHMQVGCRRSNIPEKTAGGSVPR